MNFQDLQQGNKVLLVLSKADSDTADFDNMAKSVGGFVGEHGQVEILDLEKFSGGRWSDTAYFDAIFCTGSSPLFHTNSFMSSALKLLNPGGIFKLREYTLAAGADRAASENSHIISLRTAADLNRDIMVAGFSSITADEKPSQGAVFASAWGPAAANAPAPEASISITYISSVKPKYQKGASFSLKSRKQMKAAAPPKPVVEDGADDDDDDDDLIDDDALLDEAPALTRKEDCEPEEGASGRKRACKNCTCGLKEKLSMDELVDTSAPKSACGSCYLGDAFRCSSCPYLGMPAFQPGQKVSVPDNMMDDVEF